MIMSMTGRSRMIFHNKPSKLVLDIQENNFQLSLISSDMERAAGNGWTLLYFRWSHPQC